MTAFRAKNGFWLFTTVLAAAALAGGSAASAIAATPLAATTTAAAATTAAAPAETKKLTTTVGKGDCKGQPTFSSEETLGYFIWNDDTGWHIRWTNKKKK